MKPRSIALLAAVWPLIAGSALAADVAAPAYRAPLAPPPVFSWTGFYLGVNGGYGSAKTTGTIFVTGGALNGFASTGSNTLAGGLAGGQVGANWQMGAFVVGAEGDWQWSGQQKTFVESCGIGCTLSTKGEIGSFGTLRGRLGFAMDRFLVYGTGGAAWTFLDYTRTGTLGGLSATLLRLSGDRLGWTAGGGVEWAFLGPWSAKAEYLYISTDGLTGSAGLPALFGGGTATGTVNIRDHIFRAGVNYRFGG